MKRVWLYWIVSTFIQADEVHFSFDPIASLPSYKKGFTLQGTDLWRGSIRNPLNLFVPRGGGDMLHGHVQDPSLRWDWGIRSGVKYDDPYAEWHLTATHTHFHSKSYASSQKEREIIPLWQELKSPIGHGLNPSVQSSWQLDIDVADVELGKIFAVNRFMNVTPHAGVRTSWMYQKMKIDLAQNEKDLFEQPSIGNNCLALGTRGGLDTSWTLGKNFSFFCDSALSWLLGYHNIHQRQSVIAFNTPTAPGPRINIAMLEYSLGLQYQTKFSKFQRSLSLKIGYEINYFFQSNRWMNGFSPIEPDSMQQKISLQGLSWGLQLQF